MKTITDLTNDILDALWDYAPAAILVWLHKNKDEIQSLQGKAINDE